LVFGDDGSASADVAWLWLNNQPWPGWAVRVVTGDSGPPPASAWGVPPHAEAWTPPWGRRFFDEDQLASLEYLRIDADPRLAIDEQPADLVVVGRRGLGAVQTLWEARTTDWLAQLPTHPMVLARSAAVVRRVTCCVDGSAHAQAALSAAIRLPVCRDAEVTLLAVDDGRIDVAAAVASAQRLVGAGGCRSRSVVSTGRAPQRILEHLDDEAPDLLVLGTRGWNAWDRLGSVAARVVHHPVGTCLLATAGS
jgi:nucleotide-binding universal stress UspA family protein